MIEKSFASAQIKNSSTVPAVDVMSGTRCSVPHDPPVWELRTMVFELKLKWVFELHENVAHNATVHVAINNIEMHELVACSRQTYN